MIQTLLSGCSLSDWCGFGQEVQRNNNLPPMAVIGNHQDPRCWYNILAQRLNLDLTNVSYGGFSNEEILSQAQKELCLNHDYQLVIIQLTGTQRRWFYRADNPFAFCMAHGANSQNAQEKNMLEYFRVYFNNELIEIERTLIALVLMQDFLAARGVPLVVINGINFGEYLLALRDDAEGFCYKRIPQNLWTNKGIPYAREMGVLANQIRIDNFVALDQSLCDREVDKADDQSHPGQLSNLIYADLVAHKITQILG
jgi:hypothetical protein